MDVEEKGNLALGMGADTFICPPATLGQRSWLYGRNQFDVIIDTAGAPETIAHCLPFLDSGGRYIMVGQPRPGQDVAMRGANHMFQGDGKRIIATQGGRFNPTKDVPRYVQLWQAGKIKLDSLITHHIPLGEINAGLDLVRAGMASRVLIEMS